MRPSRFIVASASIAFCVLAASTMSSTTNAQPTTARPSTVPAQLQQQDDDDPIYIALDTDGDRRFDDANRDNKPDRYFKIAKKFVMACGPIIGCAFAPPGFGQLICAVPALFTCLDAYEGK